MSRMSRKTSLRSGALYNQVILVADDTSLILIDCTSDWGFIKRLKISHFRDFHQNLFRGSKVMRVPSLVTFGRWF